MSARWREPGQWTTPVLEGNGGAGRWLPAWVFVGCYAVLLLCIPTRLVVGPIGAPGTPANLFAIAGLVWWVCAVAGGLLRTRGLTPTRVALGVFVGLALASYAAGQFQGWYQPADIHQRTDNAWEQSTLSQVTATVSSAADRGLLALAGWVGIALITAEGIRSWRELDRVMTWIVRAATFVAALGVIQYFTALNLAEFFRIPGLTPLSEFGSAHSRSVLNRIVSTSTHPIELGVAMSALLPLALHRSLHAKSRLAWIPTLVLVLAALMSVSRSAVIVAAVALVVLFIAWPWRWRLWALVVLPVAAVAGKFALPGLLGTIRSLFTGLESDPSVTGRTADYDLVFGLIGEHPVLGQGLFTFVPMVYRTIDNQGLVMLIELGIVGTAAFVALVLTSLVQARAPRRMGGTPEQRHLGVAVIAALVGIVTSYVTFDAMGFRQVAGLTFLFIGLAGAVWHLARDSQLAEDIPVDAPVGSQAADGPTGPA